MEDLSRLADLFPEKDFEENKNSGFTFAAAASACALVMVVFIAGWLSTTPKDTQITYETYVGEQSTVSLPDGSQLSLNTNSLVRVDYDDQRRLVVLERGEIHIDVEHDESRPLVVNARDKVVQAVGTAFNVELTGSQGLELIVTDGRVLMGATPVNQQFLNKVHQKNAILIAQGEKITLDEQKPAKISESDIRAALSWQQGNLSFNGESLEQAIFEISRYTSTQFEFENDEIRSVRIAGLFKAGDVNGLLIALEDTFNISSRQIGKEKISLYRE